jgi:hypothetical protein
MSAAVGWAPLTVCPQEFPLHERKTSGAASPAGLAERGDSSKHEIREVFLFGARGCADGFCVNDLDQVVKFGGRDFERDRRPTQQGTRIF